MRSLALGQKYFVKILSSLCFQTWFFITLTPAAASSTSRPFKSGAERWRMFLEKVSDKNWQVNKNRNIISSIINCYLGSCQNIPQCSGWFLSRRLRLSVKVLILRYFTAQSQIYAKCFWRQFFFSWFCSGSDLLQILFLVNHIC